MATNTTSASNPLLALAACGQSVWLDNISRDLIESGELLRLIEDDGLAGVTSNPAIFEKAIAQGTQYRRLLGALRGTGLTPKAVYETLAITDIQDAADRFAGVYNASQRRDGYVSLEVAPDLAHDSAGTLHEARRLWGQLSRPNVMIKVPATQAGLVAIEALIADGINVNVTLLFACDTYAQVAQAFLHGLERRHAQGGALDHVASVASFFISRIDASMDALIEERMTTLNPERAAALGALRGTVAIANAKLAYQHFRDTIAAPRWQALAAHGAQPQRLLWASTGTKNPHYRDVLYVEALIGAQTVNTIPPATLDAFRDHGTAVPRLGDGLVQARAALDSLESFGLSLTTVTDRLLVEGVQLFADAFVKLITQIQSKT